MDFNEKSADELAGIGAEAQATYEGIRGKNLALDMTRGKPAPDQLDLSNGILTVVGPGDTDGDDGTDYRNYGILSGIPEAKALFAEYMEVAPAEIIVGGNSSLTMMYDTIVGGMLFGMPGGSAPWGDQGSVKFICPVPGYDRHFAICERLGVGMVTVPMTPDGPDMDAVEALVADDASVKGIWCVPKYSNPSGEVYSDDVVDRLANMQVAAPDFRVIWDNAYNVHHIGEGPAPLKNLLAACKNAGTPDRVLMFGSTSKLTLPGAGVAVLAASEANIQDALKKNVLFRYRPGQNQPTSPCPFLQGHGWAACSYGCPGGDHRSEICGRRRCSSAPVGGQGDCQMDITEGRLFRQC